MSSLVYTSQITKIDDKAITTLAAYTALTDTAGNLVIAMLKVLYATAKFLGWTKKWKTK